MGIPPWVSALDLAVFYKHNDVAKLLVAARAQLRGGVYPAMHYAALSNNPEGIRILCSAGGDALASNVFGVRTMEIASAYGSEAALQELVKQLDESVTFLGHVRKSNLTYTLYVVCQI